MNKDAVGKYFIISNLGFGDFMKDVDGNLKLYDTLDDAHGSAGINELHDTLICKVEWNHLESEEFQDDYLEEESQD
jgi:hypothetical protein